MQHAFDISIAEKHGVNVAIFLNNIAFWIHKNASNKRHLREDKFWTYNTQESFTHLFPYWSRQNIRTIINYCIKNNLLIVGNHNETTYDRTGWYTLTNEGLDLFPILKNLVKSLINTIGWNQPMHVLESTNGLVGTNQPIPDIKPDIKPDNKSFCVSRISKAKSKKPKAASQKEKKKDSNEKTHDFAPMMNEKVSIERNNELKRMKIPPEFKEIIQKLKRRSMINS